MKLTEFFKYCIQMLRDSSKILAEAQEQNRQYLTMTTEQLAALSQGALFDAVLARTTKVMEGFESISDGFQTLTEPQKVFYCLSTLQTTVYESGLCKFLVTPTYVLAPYVSEYLSIIGAQEHQALFDGFLRDNYLELDHLFTLQIKHPRQLERREKMFPFYKYDDAFLSLPPLMIPLAQYAREHLEDF